MTEPHVTFLVSSDTEDWDTDETIPTVSLFAKALQVWSVCQNRVDVTVNEAALAFNTTPAVIKEAVEWHPWMFLAGDVIEHEGE